jgi:3-oxoacyl-[acyl-carrier protein] reductase
MNSVSFRRENILSKFCLDDKVAVVTGAGSGIGEAIALGFAGVDAHVVIAELNASRGEATAEKVRALGRKALALAVDVTDSGQVQDMVGNALAEFGRIDILVNNVGGPLGTRATVLELPDDAWESVIRINLRSTFLCSKFVGRVMREQKEGNIINIASGSGRRPYPEMAAYAAAKAGVIHFTQTLAVSLAPYNIRVNGIAPGPTVTPGSSSAGDEKQRAEKGGVPLGRAGHPEDMAFAAIYLASEASAFVTAVVIDVIGGPPMGSEILRRSGVWPDR